MSDQFQTGPWRIDVGAHTLHGPEGAVALEPRTMALLEYFCKHPGQTLSKDTLLDEVWGSEHFTDSVVTRAISILRSKLGDTKEESTYILTVPRRGYRFIAPVQAIESTASKDQPSAPTVTESNNRPRIRWIAAFAIVLVASVLVYAALQDRGPSATPTIDHLDSIAIAPFEVDTHNDDSSFPINGLHVDVAAQLARLQKPRVFLTDASADPFEKAVNADALLTAKGYVADGQLTLELRLFGVQTREVVWTSEYTADRGDAFSTRQRIIGDLATLSRAGLSRWEQRSAAIKVDTQAYEVYLEALWLWRQRSFESLSEGQRLFERAIALDPNFADAHAGLALSHLARASYGQQDQELAYASAAAAAEAALEMDPENPWALTARGEIAMQRDWKFDAAIELFKNAILASPSTVDARQYLAEAYSISGRHAEAIRAIEEALIIRPDSQLLRAIKGMTQTAAGEYASAAATMETLHATRPEFTWYRWYWSYALWRLGDQEGAQQVRVQEFESRLPPAAMKELRLAVEEGGANAFWEWQIARLSSLETNSATIAILLAEAYLALGDLDNGMTWIRRSIDLRGEAFPMLRISPYFDAVRETMEYQELLARHGLKEAIHPGPNAAMAQIR